MPDSDRLPSIIALLTELVRIPSRAGTDPYDPVLEAVSTWLRAHRLPCQFVTDPSGARVGVWGRIDGTRPGPCYLLNATVDTAPFGDESRWTFPPLSAAQAEGWLYGRGSGDSKGGVAIFAHVLEALLPEASGRSGSIAYLFDAAEHTGEFAGVRRFMDTHGEAMHIAGALIGYPGNERISSGGRGFARARIGVHGRSAHTGSSHRFGINAVSRAAQLIESLNATPLPSADPSGFPLPPRLSVTAIEGGSGFSVVPELVTLNLDVRLTPSFDRDAAIALVERVVHAHDSTAPDVAPARIDWLEGWPAYRLRPGEPIIRALGEAARSVFGREVPAEVVGPSSVANFLAGFDVPAVNGFGVTCENIHATNERIAVNTIAPVFEVYCRTLRSLTSS